MRLCACVFARMSVCAGCCIHACVFEAILFHHIFLLGRSSGEVTPYKYLMNDEVHDKRLQENKQERAANKQELEKRRRYLETLFEGAEQEG